jgi:hypothetical protein
MVRPIEPKAAISGERVKLAPPLTSAASLGEAKRHRQVVRVDGVRSAEGGRRPAASTDANLQRAARENRPARKVPCGPIHAPAIARQLQACRQRPVQSRPLDRRIAEDLEDRRNRNPKAPATGGGAPVAGGWRSGGTAALLVLSVCVTLALRIDG